MRRFSLRSKSLFKTVYALDFFKEAIETYTNYFPETTIQNANIRHLQSFPEADIYSFGFPCPGFSAAGPRNLKAVGLGIEAIQKGFQVYFITMGELIQLLKTEEFTHRSQIQLKRLRASDLIIIDDVMYMALDQREATLFFQLVHQLYEQSSLILTSNRSPEEWTELVDNQGMMTAILDRLLHRVEVIHMNNESHRLKHQQRIFTE